MKMPSWMVRLLCHHERDGWCVNVNADGMEGVLTIGGWQCRKCAKWKLTVFYKS